MEQDLLDVSKSKYFLLEVLNGDQNKYKELEKWFNERKIKEQITKSQEYLFDLIINGYNNSKKNNFQIEQLKKENDELKFSQNDNLSDLFLIEMNDRFISLQNKISNDFDEKMAIMEKSFQEKIRNLQKTNNEMKNQIITNKFEQNIKTLSLNMNIYLCDLKFDYSDKKGKIKSIHINKLISIVNGLFSYGNIFIYRKIINILLRRIIEIYKDSLTFQFDPVNKEKKIIVDYSTKKDYLTALSWLIDFFFYVKGICNSIIHVLDVIKTIKELYEKNSFKLSEIEKIKDFKTILTDLGKNCTYNTLVETIGSKTPLMFFKNEQEEEESGEKAKDGIKDETLKSGGKGKKKETLEEIENTIETEIEKINKLEIKITFQSLETEINALEEEEIRIKKVGAEKFDSNFSKNCILFDQIKSSFQALKSLKEKKKEIEKNLLIYSKIKKKSKCFCFSDFYDYYKKNKVISEGVFDPYKVCLELLKNELKNPVDFLQNDVNDFIAFLNELKQ